MVRLGGRREESRPSIFFTWRARTRSGSRTGTGTRDNDYRLSSELELSVLPSSTLLLDKSHRGQRRTEDLILQVYRIQARARTHTGEYTSTQP